PPPPIPPPFPYTTLFRSNKFADSQKALEDIEDGKKPRSGSPVQLVACPRCGTILADERGVPEKNTYVLDTTAQRTLVWCCNDERSEEHTSELQSLAYLVC